jgi:hypothetical protein
LSQAGAAPGPIEVRALAAPAGHGTAAAAAVQFGKVFLPQQQILLYSPDEWEEFIKEWAHSQRDVYRQVVRLGGGSDEGIDIAGLTDDDGLDGVWDLYQCKHYGDPIAPSDASIEIAKIIWHSSNGSYRPPRKHFFVAPKDCGMKLERLMLGHGRLKTYVAENWATQCAGEISKKFTVPLDGAFRVYFDAFDFAIFTFKTTLEVIDEHRTTPYHAVRFGGGLGLRPKPEDAPGEMHERESRYVSELMRAYGERLTIGSCDAQTLAGQPELGTHFNRQREFFYHAESLRNFARDTVPPRTFESLQDEVYAGVEDIEAELHRDGLTRLSEVMKSAVLLHPASNGLISVLMTQDKKGICHQLANNGRLKWTRP